MKIKNIIIILAIFLPVLSTAAVKVEFRVSKMHGLLNFILAISNEPHQAPGIKEVYDRSSYSKKDDLVRQIQMFEGIKNNVIYQNIGSGLKPISGRHLNQGIDGFIITQSIFSNSLNDFRERLLGLLSKDDYLVLFATLEKFEPVYDDLIWKKSQKNLLEVKNKIQDFSKKINMDALFSQTEIFYRAKWPQELPFVIGLYPIPFLKDFRNSSTSQSLDSAEEHGVLIGENKKENIADDLGVIFHELCHSLYKSQSKEFMSEYFNYHDKSNSPYKFLAYRWSNEALATAIGNGWAYEKANHGTLDDGSWYNDPIVDGFGKALYPLVKNYLENSKPIDSEFVTQAIEIFGKKFPNSIYEFSTLMTDMSVGHGPAISASYITQQLRSNFLVSSINTTGPLEEKEAIETLKNENTFNLIIFSPQEMKALDALIKNLMINKVDQRKVKKLKERSALVTQSKDQKIYVFIKITTAEDFGEFVKFIKAKNRLDLKDPEIKF